MKKYISKISILGLVLFIFCVSILMIPTQAYFTKVVTSVANVIRAANYDLEITVSKDNEKIDFQNGGSLAAGTYAITLTPEKDSAEHGFCVVMVGENTYYTVPIEDEALNLTLKLDTASAVRFTAHWGEVENYDVIDSEWTLIENDGTIEETTSTVVSLAQAEETTSETSTAVEETTATETTAETTTTVAEPTATETTVETTTATEATTIAGETAVAEPTVEATTLEESMVETTTEETTTLPAETTAESITDVNSES